MSEGHGPAPSTQGHSYSHAPSLWPLPSSTLPPGLPKGPCVPWGLAQFLGSLPQTCGGLAWGPARASLPPREHVHSWSLPQCEPRSSQSPREFTSKENTNGAPSDPGQDVPKHSRRTRSVRPARRVPHITFVHVCTRGGESISATHSTPLGLHTHPTRNQGQTAPPKCPRCGQN